MTEMDPEKLNLRAFFSVATRLAPRSMKMSKTNARSEKIDLARLTRHNFHPQSPQGTALPLFKLGLQLSGSPANHPENHFGRVCVCVCVVVVEGQLVLLPSYEPACMARFLGEAA